MQELQKTDSTQSRIRRAFTLIELLVVIAIISILMAIIFPAIMAAMESGRQNNTMSKMQEIQSALALYKLDNKTYPDVLFAYANTGGTDTCNARMDNIAANAATCSSDLVGLYPTYIKDWHVFITSDNPTDSPSAKIPDASTPNLKIPINYFNNTTSGTGTTPTFASKNVTFFKADSFDISPQIKSINQVNENAGGNSTTPNYIVRYQTSWTDYTPSTATDTTCYPNGTVTGTGSTQACDSSADPDYSRQLRWSLPPSDTYVTSTTWHVGSANKVLVLYLDGSVKKYNVLSSWLTTPTVGSDLSAYYASQEEGYNDTATSIAATTSPANAAVNVSGATFWRATPGLTSTK